MRMTNEQIKQSELFERYMISIGQFKRIDWRLTVPDTAPYMSQEKMKAWFDKWLKTHNK